MTTTMVPRLKAKYNETIRAEFAAVGLKLAWDKQAPTPTAC